MRWLESLIKPDAPGAAAPSAVDATPTQPTPSDGFASFADWKDYHHANHPLVRERHQQILAMADFPAPTLTGYCATCAAEREFGVAWHGTGQPANLRESLVCPACRLNARQRCAFGLLRDRVPASARVYATEQTTPAYAWLRRRHAQVQGSEYGVSPEQAAKLRPWMSSLGIDEPVANQDVTALTFADASVDAIVSFDVLEHVPDYPQALREFARVLAPGGLLVLTVPFMESFEQTRVRARIDTDGNIEHLLPPEIHGDPVSGGVLCFYHFGWDFLDTARDAGFASAQWHRSWAPEHGVFGMWTLLAVR